MTRTSLVFSTLLVAVACRSATPPPFPEPPDRTFRCHYEATAEPAAGTSWVDLWVPLPIDGPEQRIRDLAIEASQPYAIRPLPNGTGQVLHLSARGEPLWVRASYVVDRWHTDGGQGADPAELEDALQPDRMIPLDGKLAEVADNLPTSGSSLETGRILYQHTLDRMTYAMPAGEAWGRGDAEWASESHLGNCTDFHSYFIGLARRKGIPARFEMGFPIPPATVLERGSAEVEGYHCWAWFWTDDGGWIPVDITEADKNVELTDYYFGHLDANRVTLTGGRDLVLDPPTSAGPLNFFAYPYVEVDGLPTTDGVTRRFWVSAE